MNIGGKIIELRAEVTKREAELEEKLNELETLEASCSHQNTRPGKVIFKLDDGDIQFPMIKCLDCGIGMPVSTRKKKPRKKLLEAAPKK